MQIVYYSLSGVTEKIARKLATQLGLPVYRIEDVRSRKGAFHFIRSGFEAKFKRTPRIKEMPNLKIKQDHVVLLAPIWAGSLCSPLRTFCKQNAGTFQTFSLVLTHLDPQKKFEEVASEIESITGATCKVFGSFCSKNVAAADVQALANRLKQAKHATR